MLVMSRVVLDSNTQSRQCGQDRFRRSRVEEFNSADPLIRS